MVRQVTRTVIKYLNLQPYRKVEKVWETEDHFIFKSKEEAEKYEKENASILRYRKLPSTYYETDIPEYFDSWIKLEEQRDIDYVLTFKNVKVKGELYPGVIVTIDHEDIDDYTPERNYVYTLEHVKTELKNLLTKIEELNE